MPRALWYQHPAHLARPPSSLTGGFVPSSLEGLCPLEVRPLRWRLYWRFCEYTRPSAFAVSPKVDLTLRQVHFARLVA